MSIRATADAVTTANTNDIVLAPTTEHSSYRQAHDDLVVSQRPPLAMVCRGTGSTRPVTSGKASMKHGRNTGRSAETGAGLGTSDENVQPRPILEPT